MRTLSLYLLASLLIPFVGFADILEERTLRVLTPDQAQALADGLAPEDIDLPNGETLAEYLVRQDDRRQAGLVLRTLEPCLVLNTSQAVEKAIPGYPLGLLLRGESRDLSPYGGSAEGCGIPGLEGETFRSNRARALLLSVEIRDAVESGSLAFESTGSLVTFRPGETITASSLIVPLCDEESLDPCGQGDLRLLLEGQADVAITVHGYLEPLELPELVRETELEETEEERASKASTAPFWEKRTDNDDIYYNEGRVGIRTDAPEATLHVRGADSGAVISQPSSIHGVSNYFEPDYPTLKLFRGSNSRGALLSLGNQDGSFYLYGSDSTFRIYDPGQTTRFLLKSNGFLGLGTGDPQKTLHVDGSFMLRDPTDLGILLRTLQRSPTGYGGGGAHDTQVLTLNTPYETVDDIRSRSSIVLGSPEIWGGESAYLYGFGSKNIRLGAINDSHRRAEIEIFNNNTSQGKIFFRTGRWQDPANVPGNDTNVRMLIDHSGNVGVGTTSPNASLHVVGSAQVDGSALFRQAGFSGTGSASSQEHLFRVWGHHPARIEQSHSLGGDGTDPPYFAPQDPTLTLLRGSTHRGATLSLGNQSGKFHLYANHQAMRLYAPDGAMAIQTLTPAGSTGLGVDEPTERLEVDGNVKVSGNIQLSGNLVGDGDICIGQCG